MTKLDCTLIADRYPESTLLLDTVSMTHTPFDFSSY
jgi:hypothetical protein